MCLLWPDKVKKYNTHTNCGTELMWHFQIKVLGQDTKKRFPMFSLSCLRSILCVPDKLLDHEGGTLQWNWEMDPAQPWRRIKHVGWESLLHFREFQDSWSCYISSMCAKVARENASTPIYSGKHYIEVKTCFFDYLRRLLSKGMPLFFTW